MSLFKKSLLLLLGLALGIAATHYLQPHLTQLLGANVENAEVEAKPLYWVAPMDPNYRRDKPGKSPMGMDLVPVYAEESNQAQHGPGTVSISSVLENNLAVRKVKVEQGPWQDEIHSLAYVQYDEERLQHIHSRVEGWIEKLFVKTEGETVEKGQALYQIYSPALVNAQQELLLAMERKNQFLISAAEDRLKALKLPRHSISKLKKTKKIQQRISYYAPQGGVVNELKIRQGYFVKPEATLMSIASLDEVWLEAEVFERQAALVKVGMPATIRLDYAPEQSWQAKVDYIYPSLDPKTRSLKLRLRLDNPEHLLKPNMFAQLSIHIHEPEPTLYIPKSALIRLAHMERVVLALGQGQYKSIAVRSGRMNASHVEILEGLQAGDEVVVSAQFLLDSESSLSSDFKRYEPNSSTVTITGVIVELKDKALSISHDAVPAINWPAMTMDFLWDESLPAMSEDAKLEKGRSIEFEIAAKQQGFPIKSYRLGEIQAVPEFELPESDEDDEDLDWLDLDDEAADSSQHEGHH